MEAKYIVFATLVVVSILLVCIVTIPIIYYIKAKPPQNTGIQEQKQEVDPKALERQYIKSAYQQKWMFTINEKNSFYALEKIVKEEGYRLFAKVRLFDLVTPVRNHPKYKTNLYKIQAKHLDFVITTNNLVAKYVIELDDNSHNTAERKERDEFVDMVLQTCGYKVLHVRGIQEDVIKAFLKGNAQQSSEQEKPQL